MYLYHGAHLMSNEMLEAHLKDLVIEATKALADRKPSDLPTLRRFAVEAGEKGKTRLVSADIPNWHQAGQLLRPIVERLPSWSHAIAAAVQDQRIAALDDKWVRVLLGGRKARAGGLPWHFLVDYFFCSREFKFRSGLFRDRYREMLRYHDPGSQIRLKVVAPLSGFAATQATISLGGGRIRRISLNEVLDLANDAGFLDLFYGGMRGWFTYVIEAEVDVPKHVSVEDSPVRLAEWNLPYAHAGLVNREVILLRCFTGYPVSAPTYIYRYGGWPADLLAATQLVELPWRMGVSRSPPEPLSHSAIRALRRIRSGYLAIRPVDRDAVAAAARRIALAEDQPYAGDRVVDYVSAIEGLVVEDKGPEIRHRFSERVAFLLGRQGDGADRKNIAKMAGALYDARSKVVHGGLVPDDYGFATILSDGGPKPKAKDRRQIVEAERHARTLARSVLREMVRRGGLVENWDDIIMGVSQPAGSAAHTMT